MLRWDNLKPLSRSQRNKERRAQGLLIQEEAAASGESQATECQELGLLVLNTA